MRIFNMVQGVSLIIFLWLVSVAVAFQEKIFDEKLLLITIIEMVNFGIKVLIVNYDERFIASNYQLTPKKAMYPLIVVTS